METLEEKLAKLDGHQMREQFGLMYIDPPASRYLAVKYQLNAAVGWYREVHRMGDSTEWDGPYVTARDALRHAKH